MDVILLVFIALAISAAASFVEAGILWAIYTYAITAVFPTLPSLGYWTIFWLMIALNIISSAFKSKITINKD